MRQTKFIAVIAIFIFGLSGNIWANGNTDSPQAVQTQNVVSGLVLPTWITNAKDGSNRLFMLLKRGFIRVRNPITGTVTDFMDISARVAGTVSVGDERGLLGMAFHPQFAQNGKFYLNYTRVPDGATVVAEYQTTDSTNQTGNPASERVLFTIPQPFTNHNGGMIEFGPDGYLYIGTGDGGSGNDPGARAQNRSLLLGKMLRIDVNPTGSFQYSIPPDNPFVGASTARCDTGSTTAGTTCQEIWTIGMRNPWRWSFDRAGTRQLIAGDVGQGVIEEIDIIQPGRNYGWRVYEGTQCTNLDPTLCAGGTNPIVHEPPIIQYNHTAGRCSVTGGYVYRGKRGVFPQGAYIYADYCTGEIWSLLNGNNNLVLDTAFQITTFGEDEQGELYLASNSTTAGTIQKLVDPVAPIPSNSVADFSGDLQTDISVFRGSNGTWYSLNSFDNSFSAFQFGSNGDRPVPGDYDYDGKTDYAVFRPSTGVWYILNSSNNTFSALQFGANGDVPLPGDFDGDKKSDVAVWRPTTGVWYILNSGNGSFTILPFGLSTDRPVAADYDGDGKTDISVFRGAEGNWYMLQSSGGFSVVRWGANGDIPAMGDYDGDSKADQAVFRPTNGVWYILNSSNRSSVIRQFGANGDTPVAGDYDGDNKADIAVYRNQSGQGVWYIISSFNPNNTRVVPFGLGTDNPVPAFDVP